MAFCLYALELLLLQPWEGNFQLNKLLKKFREKTLTSLRSTLSGLSMVNDKNSKSAVLNAQGFFTSKLASRKVQSITRNREMN